MEEQMNTTSIEIAALSLEELDAVSGGHMSSDGKTFSVIVWKSGDTKYGFSVGSNGTTCTTVSGPNGHGSACTVPV
jgi:hypothetical protein